MNKISCMIVDDEPLALNLLESYVNQTPFLELKARCSSAVEALQYLEHDDSVTLIFLDIQMPDLSGIDFSKTLAAHIRVIFTTAFEQYAIEGYKVNAVGYLLKPFDYSEFLAACGKARQMIVAPLSKPRSGADFIFVKSEYRQVKIMLNDVLYIEGLKDYVKIVLHSQPKPVLTLMSLKKLEEDLPAEMFMRVHRSFIVALDKIEAIERSHIIIRNERIPVAAQYKEAFDHFIGGKMI